MNTQAKKSKRELSSQARGVTPNRREQTKPVPTPLPERGRTEGSKTETATRRSGDKSLAISPDAHSEADEYAHVMEMLGTTDPNFAKGIYAQLMGVSSRGGGMFDAVGLFFSLAAVKSKQPKDQFQAMLVAQAAVTHVLTMKHANQLAEADHPEIQDSAERAYNKLARTFVMQLEAIHRLESGGEQKVTVQAVQNVSVSDGGQAIVGNLTHGARDEPVEKTAALTDARQAAMPIINARESTPVPAQRGRNK
jgi:hypothetical protein